MNNEKLIEYLSNYDNKRKEEGFVPTVEMLVEELREEVLKEEANRLSIHND